MKKPKSNGFFVNKSGCCDECGPIIGNAEVIGNARRESFDGVDHLVFPVVAIVEGVLNGFMVRKEEFGKFVHAWEGRPIPVNHPEVNGIHVSANIPEIYQKTVVGRFQRVELVGNKLKGEIWIDVNLAKKKGFSDVISRLESNGQMEVSTAYFADTLDKPGSYNGIAYNGEHINLRPDHLALLPNDRGACSIDDGCGVNANTGLLTNIINHLKELVTLTKKPEASAMKKTEKVAKIIAHKGNNFSQSDEQSLMAMEEAMLDKLLPNEKSAEEEDEEKKKGKEKPSTNSEEQEKEGAVANLSAEDQIALNWARRAYDSEKTATIARLAANKSCTFSKEELEKMDLQALEKIEGMLRGNDYSGRGFPMRTNYSASEDDVEPLEAEPFAMSFANGHDKGKKGDEK